MVNYGQAANTLYQMKISEENGNQIEHFTEQVRKNDTGVTGERER